MELRNFDEMEYHPLSEEIVDILSNITQNENRPMFRVMLTYYWGMLAAHMRASVHGWHNTTLPINIYAVNLSDSGTGKGFTTSRMETKILHRFRGMFIQETFPAHATNTMYDIATERSKRPSAEDPDTENEKLIKEFDSAGPLVFSFDSGTTAAVKQMRHKLLLAGAGALNFQVDEIGDNLSSQSQSELLVQFLELYDRGDIKDKLVKNTSDNTRFERIEGMVPTNMLLFGTSTSLLDGSETETKFLKLLESGYARRCIFAYSRGAIRTKEKTAEELINDMFNHHYDDVTEELAEYFESLADISNMNRQITIDRNSCLYLMKYRLHCQARADALNETKLILKTELTHRYFKVLKLAACYAFIDDSDEVTITHLENAMKLMEDSGQALQNMLNTEKPYMKLAKCLATVGEDMTLSDIDETLPCFRGSKAHKEEMIQYAISWGYRNDIIIKRLFIEGIMFLRGETLQETDLNNLTLTVSDHVAYRYEQDEGVTFEDLTWLGSVDNMHWANHQFIDNHRKNSNVIPGFDLIVLDVDSGFPLSTAMMILQEYKAVIYTTKSHTEDHNRYRIIMPINYRLELDEEDYKTFINNILEDLPIDTGDDSSNQCAKKWLTNDGDVYVLDGYTLANGEQVEGKLFDVLPYIPKTSRNDTRINDMKQFENFDGLQRWVIQNTGDGNRNKQLYRYAMILADSGAYNYSEVENMVIEMNNMLPDKLTDTEIKNTIMKSVAKKVK